jgi:hypothetical protein
MKKENSLFCYIFIVKDFREKRIVRNFANTESALDALNSFKKKGFSIVFYFSLLMESKDQGILLAKNFCKEECSLIELIKEVFTLNLTICGK